LFYQSKFGANLNPFEIKLIRFENRIGSTMLPAPPVSAAPTASPRCLAPHPAIDDRGPRRILAHLSVTSSDVVPTPPPSTVARQRAARTRHGWATATPTPRRRAAPHLARAPSLSPAPPPHGAHPSGPPPGRSPLKQSRRPPAEFFLPRAPFVSSVQARAPHTHLTQPRHPPHRLPATGAPPPRRTPNERSHRPPPSGERPPSCSIPQSTAASSPRWSPSSCRTPPRASTTTGALSSPTAATASAPTPPLRPLTSSHH
jgi:type VI secretion system secreted protein VgrG